MGILGLSPADANSRIAIDKLKRWGATAAALAVVLVSWGVTPAAASSPYVFISDKGVDNSCGESYNPCHTFEYAMTQVAAGGEIHCLDSVSSIRGTITKSLTLHCEEVSNSNNLGRVGALAVTVGASDTVILRGLSLDGGRYTDQGLAINFSGSGTLIVDHVNATNWVDGGVFFQPNGPAQLKVLNSHFANIGRNNAGAAIRIVPQGTGSARVQLDHVSVDGNVFGVAADGTGSTTGINVTVSNSELNGNQNDGLIAVTSSGTAPIGVLATNIRSTNNGYGIRSIGPNVTVRVDASKIAGNGTALSASSGGALLSAGNNIVEANGSNGAFTGSVALK